MLMDHFFSLSSRDKQVWDSENYATLCIFLTFVPCVWKQSSSTEEYATLQ